MATKSYRTALEMVRKESDDKAFEEAFASKLANRKVIKKLIALRLARDMSQAEIAKRLNCTQSRISKLESGCDDDLTTGELKAYADAIGLSVQISLAPTDIKLVDRVKLHAFAIHDLLMRLVDVAHADQDDAKTVEGVARFFGEAFVNLIGIVKDGTDKLPLKENGHPYIEIDVLDYPKNEEPEDEPVVSAAAKRRQQRRALAHA